MQNSEKEPSSKALYARIVSEIRARILAGEIVAGMRLPTEHELAQRYHASRGTIRQALSILVNEGLLERIQGSGTFVRPLRQEIGSGTTAKKNIGVILSQVNDELNMNILLGVEQAAKPRGYQLLFAFTEEDANELALDVARLRPSTAGLIIFPVSDRPHNETIARLQAEGMPIVLVDRYIHDVDCDYVVSDNLGGGYRATEHLLILGHARVGFVSSHLGGLQTTSVRDRWEGYRKALRDYQRPYDDTLVFHHAPTPAPEPPNVYDEIVTSPQRPDAFFAVNDAVALELFQATRRNHIRVPEDIALVGFDDVSYAAHLSIPLTTVGQQRIEMGLRAGILLLNRIEGQLIGSSKHIELPTNLIIRQSCGARLRITNSET